MPNGRPMRALRGLSRVKVWFALEAYRDPIGGLGPQAEAEERSRERVTPPRLINSNCPGYALTYS